jgi:hypothetical protein
MLYTSILIVAGESDSDSEGVMWGHTYGRDMRRATERAARAQEEATTSG